MAERDGRASAGAAVSEARARRILDTRTAQLAARRAAAAAEPGLRAPVLACAVGPEIYGIALDAIAEVLPARPCAPVAGAPVAVLGALGVAGRVFSVVDLAAALGLPAAPPSAGSTEGHLLRLRHAPRRILLRVDRALGVVLTSPLAPGRQPAPGMGGKAVSGYALAPAGTVAARETLLGLLDPDELLRPLLALPSESGA
jgi:purine-binding chemotaxis protein CheW